MIEGQTYQEFYTKKRWNNWLEKIKETDLNLDQNEEDSSELKDVGLLVVNMQDDVILACLKLIAKYDQEQVSQEDANKILAEIRDIVLNEIEPISEDVDLLLDSIQSSLVGALVSCEWYINNAYEEDCDIKSLLNSAIEAEKEENIEDALAYIAEIGACVLNGSTLPDSFIEDIEYGLVAEWIDGIDSIAAAMVGSDSYKEDDGDYDPV
ncbi:DUF2150 family protein [Methanosalsum natronophilum]|uniref:DUF2150 family protein n=1 Tax=Methanosalsum natronophilum TaxID=768733 RepID=A0A3R7VTC0_9EURY|nr:DUF2150 family protein [Methanosalsum natronophilum]MCS3923054.1 hypothetical protein [Methanosalsum natronophilum]RQD85096.1 MAG: DUF2150 family protein [Methanosalsum natronophilum]